MAQQTILEVAPRTIVGKATKQLRRVGIIPGNVYGHRQSSVAVQVEALTFERLRRDHGFRNIISLRMPETSPQTVLVRHIQRHPASGAILHVDFARVNLGETIETKIPLQFVGEAAGVKTWGGMLLHLMEALPVECKVSEIVEGLDVDISPLTELSSVLYAKDVTLPAGYSLLVDPDEPIAKINPPRVEAAPSEEVVAAEAPAEAATEES